MKLTRALFLVVFVVVSILLSPKAATAEEDNAMIQEASITPVMDGENLMETKTASPSQVIKYDLAFPGILPDNPLYKLKVLRDKVSVALITDPKKRIEFYLLQTDKGILSTAMLVDKGKNSLAAQTALKAENNYTLLTYELWKLKNLDKALYYRLHTASLKHQEVLASLMKRVSKETAKTFLQVSDFSKRNWQSVENFQAESRIPKAKNTQ